MLRKFKISIDGVNYLVEMEELTTDNQNLVSENPPPIVPPVKVSHPSSTAIPSSTNDLLAGTPVFAPMPGKILKILVQNGENIVENQPLLILEAMKMENQIVANKAGKVVNIHVSEGQNIDSGATLIEIG